MFCKLTTLQRLSFFSVKVVDKVNSEAVRYYYYYFRLFES